jgi:hypothetical protein
MKTQWRGPQSSVVDRKLCIRWAMGDLPDSILRLQSPNQRSFRLSQMEHQYGVMCCRISLPLLPPLCLPTHSYRCCQKILPFRTMAIELTCKALKDAMSKPHMEVLEHGTRHGRLQSCTLKCVVLQQQQE